MQFDITLAPLIYRLMKTYVQTHGRQDDITVKIDVEELHKRMFIQFYDEKNDRYIGKPLKLQGQ